MVKEQDKTLNILTHVLAIFVGFWGPLIIFLVSKEKEVKEHSKRALNWQISFLLYSIISGILVFVIIGIVMLIALGIMNFVFCIIATIKASNDELWDYPLAIPFLK